MAKIIETFENATLISVEQLGDTHSYKWDWRYQFIGCKGTLYIGESQQKRSGECFIMLTDKKDFQLTTGYGKIEMTEKFIKIATKNSSYIFLIE